MLLFAYVFIGLSVLISLLQIALALGAPLGEFTLGGKFTGKLPLKMRITALLQIIILFLFNVMVVSKAGLAFASLYSIAKIGVWFVFAFFIIGSIANLTSPSKKERVTMGPLNIVALICSFMVAIL